jgi:molybdate transport repressor ModE-like protein
MKDWGALRLFLDVAGKKSVSQAARDLNLTHATVRAKIKRLEDAFGVTLIRRTPGGTKLTPSGQALLDALRRVDGNLKDVEGYLKRGKEGVRAVNVHIAAPEGLTANWLLSFVPAIAAPEHADISFHFHTTLTPEANTGRAYDGVLRVQHSAPQAETFRTLGVLHLVPMASRGYVERFGIFAPGDDPSRHRWIEYTPFRLLNGTWDFWFAKQHQSVRPTLAMATLAGTVNAVLEGQGIAMMPTYLPVRYPDLAVMAFGHTLHFPIWFYRSDGAVDPIARQAAETLVHRAIDRTRMPWFRDELILPDEFGADLMARSSGSQEALAEQAVLEGHDDAWVRPAHSLVTPAKVE